MGRILIIVILLLGGACPGQLPSSHLTLNATQKSFESFVISCMVKLPNEWVTQVHWKERHSDGKYSIIAVQNPHWGNFTQIAYNMMVKLNKLDDTTYTLEIVETDKVVCCEVVTFPSGMIQQNCITIEGDSVSGDNDIQAVVLGIGGFFIFGSFILLCLIFWMKKNTRRALNLRETGQQVWNRSQRSSVPYTRTPPSVNLAYEPPLDSDILHNEAMQRTLHHQTPLGNQLILEVPPMKTPRYQEISPLRNQWLSETPAVMDPPSYPNSSSLDISSSANHIYSNIHRHKRPCLKMTHLQNSQNESLATRLEPDVFLHTTSTRPTFNHVHHTTTTPCLCEETSYFFEDAFTLQPPRLGVPRTPDTLFTTINPMYQSRKRMVYPAEKYLPQVSAYHALLKQRDLPVMLASKDTSVHEVQPRSSCSATITL